RPCPETWSAWLCVSRMCSIRTLMYRASRRYSSISNRGSTTAATSASSSPIRYEAQPRSSCVICRKSIATRLGEPRVADPAGHTGGGRFDDLSYERAQVASCPPVGELAVAARAALDQLEHDFELSLRAELACVRA